MSQSIQKRFLLILLPILALLVGSLAWLWLRPSQEDTAWQDVLGSGVLRVGLDAAYPPFEYIDERTGAIVGFDVDLAHALGERLGLQIELHNITYDGLFDALLIGNVDVLISALVAAPDFAGKASFTTPYFNAGEHLVVLQTSPIRWMEDLESRTVAVEYGSGGDVEMRQWQRRLSRVTVLRYSEPNAALDAVLADDADAALVDGISAYLSAGQHPDLRIAMPVTDNLFAVAVHPDSLTLLEEIDKALQGMKEDGTLELLYERWFSAGIEDRS